MATSKKAASKSNPKPKPKGGYLHIYIPDDVLKRPAVMEAAKALIAALGGQGEK